MQGKVALLTGGIGVVGTAIARQLASRGAKVAVSYHKETEHRVVETWQTEQKSQGFDFKVAFADMSQLDSMLSLIQELVSSFGKIDILVNNIGVAEDATLMKLSFIQWNKTVNTNLNGVFSVTRHILQHMIENQYGRIINITSTNGQNSQFRQTNYCSAKAGMHGFTKALAYEVAKKGITVNTVSPGYIKIPMFNQLSSKILDKMIQQIPVGRLAEPSEVARVVEFLASEHSGYITGSNLAVNGGQHM